MAALFTKVSLRTSAEALLLCSSGTTFQTFFCSLFTSLNNYALNLMILKGNMGFSDPRFFYYARFKVIANEGVSLLSRPKSALHFQ